MTVLTPDQKPAAPDEDEKMGFRCNVERTDYIAIPLPNGITLGAKLWLPIEPGGRKVPAIIDYHPYRGCDFTAAADERTYAELAARGYACIKLDARGTGNSSGLHVDQFAQAYWEDACHALDWIARQPWCSGRTGMTGLSWPAHASLMVACEQPSSLGAILPVNAADDRYLNRHQGGCLLVYAAWHGPVLAGMHARPPLPWVVGEDWKSIWMERLEAYRNYFEFWSQHPLSDTYWEPGSAARDYKRIKVPVLMVAGWADSGYVVNIPRVLTMLDAPSKGIMGPWGHSMPQEALPGPGIDFVSLADRWFGHWLKNEDNKASDDPVARSWLVDGTAGPNPSSPTRPGRWVADFEWPPSTTRIERWNLSHTGLCQDAPEIASPCFRSIRSKLTSGCAAGEWMPWYPTGLAPHMPEDQRTDDGQSLLFDSPPVDASIDLLGEVEVALRVSSDCDVGQVVVRLCDVAPDGSSTRIAFGFVSLRQREGDARCADIEPGVFYDVSVKMFPAGWQVAKGHSLRLAIATSYWPVVWPESKPATLSIDLGASSLRLPVRYAATADDNTLGIPPDETAKRAVASLAAPHMTRRRDFDVATGTMSITVDEDCGSTLDLETNLETSSKTLRRFTIQTDDPLSAECLSSATWSMCKDDWHCTVSVESTTRADADNWVIATHLVARERAELVFERHYERKIPREPV
ncbi:CocE/NonD family hydrolase [Agrobacterium sp. NPDC089420]|uniref:CocE/NonD family hydrolase n=1 Tax=Agrobacterium sp. NPDC089420 TaxID=3363918 RepID=UPI00384FF984